MICRKATFTISVSEVMLPDANSFSSRAQNRHFCALLSVSFFPMAPPCQQQTSSGGEKYSGLASNLAHLGRIC